MLVKVNASFLNEMGQVEHKKLEVELKDRQSDDFNLVGMVWRELQLFTAEYNQDARANEIKKHLAVHGLKVLAVYD